MFGSQAFSLRQNLSLPTKIHACLHCENNVPGGRDDGFCCEGCKAVYSLIHSSGLQRYYELGKGVTPPLFGEALDKKLDLGWVFERQKELRRGQGLCTLDVDLQGVHCSACIWLIEKLFQRENGNRAIFINSSIGTAKLYVESNFQLDHFARELRAFGYDLGPSLKTAEKKPSAVLWRMGVCFAIAMNTMTFAFATYFGLNEGSFFRLLELLSLSLSTISVWIGGGLFFKTAVAGLKRGILGLDVPIAVGILTAYGSSTLAFILGRYDFTFFDTLNIFIALMLLGRFLQERIIDQNKAFLLRHRGTDAMYTRRIEPWNEKNRANPKDKVETILCKNIEKGNTLLLAHRDLVPVDCMVLDERPTLFSFDWVSGESSPEWVKPGETVKAGAFVQSQFSVRLEALQAFEESAAFSLIEPHTTPFSQNEHGDRVNHLPRSTRFWQLFSRYYTLTVLTISGASFIFWWLISGDLMKSLSVLTSLLIVTCPCAFGIAAPLAYELAQAHLRSKGLYIRSPSFLDRLVEVTDVVFDKTGTLTTGELCIENKEQLHSLNSNQVNVLYTMVASSSHPKSEALKNALSPFSATLLPLQVREELGTGLTSTCRIEQKIFSYELGKRRETNISQSSFERSSVAYLGDLHTPNKDVADQGEKDKRSQVLYSTHNKIEEDRCDLFFYENDTLLLALKTTENLRPEAHLDIQELQKLSLEPWIVSGDKKAAVAEIGALCGIAESHQSFENNPRAKLEWLRDFSKKTSKKILFIGDGINDSLIAEGAYCSGTPSVERPFMASKCDFYFLSYGLGPVRYARETAVKLRHVIKTCFGIALLYNALTVSLSMVGLMSPVLCAVVMPISSLSTVLFVRLSMKRIN